jgi:saccharopine dehydrogenase-like NADP-dependent oxidoreductase
LRHYQIFDTQRRYFTVKLTEAISLPPSRMGCQIAREVSNSVTMRFAAPTEVFMSQKHVLVLGCGMQGSAALDDLYRHVDSDPIVVADKRSDLIEFLGRYPDGRVTGRRVDLTTGPELRDLMAGASVVIEALPPSLTLEVARLAADVGVSLVSSMYYVDPSETDPESVQKRQDELEALDREAAAKGIVILPEFGLDPGIDLILGARALGEFDEVHTFNSYGSGVPAPEHASNPLKYKFSWSVLGVLRASKRPATIVARGRIEEIPGNEIFRPENTHTIEIDALGGTLECFANGNAAHYLEVFNLRGRVQEMGRYTCRYPGHSAFWDRMVNCGYLDEAPIQVGGVSVAPIEFTAALLSGQDQFQFGPDEADLAMVRVDAAGWSGGRPKRVLHQLIDRRDLTSGLTAMQRTVGFTMGLGARLILEKKLPTSGLLSPTEVPFDLLEEGLESFGMHITREELPWGEAKVRTS